jgi:hypothetical protein
VGKSQSCDVIPPYEAYLILQHDPEALQLATAELSGCYTRPPTEQEVEARAAAVLEFSEPEWKAALRGIESVVRRMASLPGQRSVVIISGGFLTETLHFDLGQIADRALRSGVVLNAIDARGLYTDPTLDASQGYVAMVNNPTLQEEKRTMLVQSARRQTDGMASLASDTGGIFFSNSNDLEAGFRKAAGVPEAFYVLAFSPQNLKFDGNFHPIQVKLVAHKGLEVQARKGYYAPRRPTDPAAQEKEEIQEAVYSQEETQELPIDVHTQFFMKNETDARITVLTHIDLRPLHFRKEQDRNIDTLTFVTVAFDRDGHPVIGQEKSLDLCFHDSSMERFLQSGITIKTLLDVQPGTYLVRTVVRDSETGQISGVNRTVDIPY